MGDSEVKEDALEAAADVALDEVREDIIEAVSGIYAPGLASWSALNAAELAFMDRVQCRFGVVDDNEDEGSTDEALEAVMEVKKDNLEDVVEVEEAALG